MITKTFFHSKSYMGSTEEFQKEMGYWAKQACLVLNACNVSGVIFDYARFMRWLCDSTPLDTDGRNFHPVTILFAQAISNIVSDCRASWPDNQFSEAYQWCKEKMVEYDTKTLASEW